MIIIEHSSWNQIQLMKTDSWLWKTFGLINQGLHKLTINTLREKEFKEGDLVWKIVLLIGTKDPTFGKWSPNQEGPLIVSQVIPRRAYRLVQMQGQEQDKALNGKFLKKNIIHLFGKIIETKRLVVIGQLPSLEKWSNHVSSNIWCIQ